MTGKLFVAITCVLCAVINAQRIEEPKFNVNKPDSTKFVFNPKPVQPDPIKLYGGGGGSPGKGYDVFIGAEKKLWESGNGKHSVHGSGTYGQHLGGPYGNSQPSYSGGATYKYNFG